MKIPESQFYLTIETDKQNDYVKMFYVSALQNIRIKNYLISLEIVKMEELQRVRKARHIPEEIKAKRKAFNNKRIHTMPSDTNDVQKPKRASGTKCMTQRSSRDAIK